MNRKILTKITVLVILTTIYAYSENSIAQPFASGFQTVEVATVSQPRGVTKIGNSLISLSLNGTLIKIDPDGVKSNIAQLPAGTWVGPSVGNDGSIFASRYSHHEIWQVSPDGTQSMIATLAYPAGLAYDSATNRLFIASYQYHFIASIDLSDNTVRTDCVASGVSAPDGLAFHNGDLFIASRGTGTIERVSSGCGTAEAFATGTGSGAVSIAVDHTDSLLVSSYYDGYIRRVDSTGVVETFAGDLNAPVGIITSSNGGYLVAEMGSGKIWSFFPQGIFGHISGLAYPITVTCLNERSSESYVVTLEIPTAEFDCSLGLTVLTGDVITITIQSSPSLSESIPPLLGFTSVPVLYSDDNLFGRALVDNPSLYTTATYIRVNGKYYTKPYYVSPTTALNPDGTFEVDINTGGYDTSATKIVTYLIDANYAPPLLSGQTEIPPEIDNIAIGKAVAGRLP